MDVPFAEENGEQVATFAVAPGVTSVGFIVKLPNWAAKDVNMDQFIDVAAYVSGTVHIYVESGVEGYTTVLSDDIVSGIKVKSSIYREGTGIQVAMTMSLTDFSNAFTVIGSDGPLTITSVAPASSSTYLISTAEELDLFASYSLVYEGEEYPIRLPNVYSTDSFEAAYTYEGDDLGATWTAEKTTFRLWAPTAASVKVNLYQSGTPGTDDLIGQLEMAPDVNGTWVAEQSGDLNGTYYTYLVEVNGSTVEACDPYARTTGVNGQRAMVIDLDSTAPYNGEVRVSEMKQMVKSLHDNGISVIMDVVYNHVYNAGSFCVNQIVPGYFSRISENGEYSNGSGCGNDTASERAMVRKYIVDSVLYWAEEYHIDGFRFDLVGLLDTQTINEIVETVHAKYPNVIFYGEGWTLSTNVTKDGFALATQTNSAQTPGFAYFSDNIRDALKGSVFNNNEKGYVSGASGCAAKISQYFLGDNPWCDNPTQIINYASCHDNMSLFDRLTQSTPDASVEDRIRMNNLAGAIYMTAQGVPFLQAGEEMLRSKPLDDGTFDHNSYSSPDSVNSLKWDDLNDAVYQNVYNYYKGLIAFRQAHPALRMTSAEDIATGIATVNGLAENVTAFHIAAGTNGEENDLFIVFNPNAEATKVELPDGEWTVFVNDEAAGTEALGTAQRAAEVAPISALVLIRTGEGSPEPTPSQEPTDTPIPDEPNTPDVSTKPGSSNAGLIAGIVAAVVVVVAVIAFVVIKKRKK